MIRMLLQPSFSIVENHGAFLNDVTVKNESLFTVTDVDVSISYTCSQTPRHRYQKTGSINSGETCSWNNIFKNGGLFGRNITNVKIEITCAED